ncbi:MAG TPA: gamma-glutamyl kinase, partial [Rhodobacterales bacterium]|nr:gamma-glutamyl kinase [Rhodobacterales bacterium]
MQIFLSQKLAFLAVPKTGTTAIEQGLAPYVAIDIRRPPGVKHINGARFHRQFRPFLKSALAVEVETFAVMREPVERLASWWRYLQRPEIEGKPRSMRGVSFDTFLEAHAEDEPDTMGRIGGDQSAFLMGQSDRPFVTHIFEYGREDLLQAFLKDRFGKEIKLPRVNVSPSLEVVASEEALSLFR